MPVGSPMFDGYPDYNPLRSLALPPVGVLMGEDVYALQLGMNAIGNFKNPIVVDGILGTKTSKAIEAVQRRNDLVVDGVAGGLTQRSIALAIGKEAQRDYPLPYGLPAGQLEHESGFRLGNYSRPIRDDGTWDAGVAQRNTAYHRPQDAFDPVASIRLLCGFVKNSHDVYAANNPGKSERILWGWAAGSWNAPYYTNYFAGVKPWAVPGPLATARLNEYIVSVTAYLEV